MEAEKETKQFKWLSGNGGNGPVFPIDYSQRSFAKYLNEDPRLVNRYIIDHPFFHEILLQQFCKNRANEKFPNRSKNAILSIPAESAVFFKCFYELAISKKYHAALCSGTDAVPEKILTQFLHDLCLEIFLHIECDDEKENPYYRHVLFKNEVFRRELLSDLWAQELEPRIEKIITLSKTASTEKQLESLMDCILCLDRNIINLQNAAQYKEMENSTVSNSTRTSSKTDIQNLLEDLLQRNQTESMNSMSPFDTYWVDNIVLKQAESFGDDIHTLQDAFYKLSHFPTKPQKELENFARREYLEQLGKKVCKSSFENQFMLALKYVRVGSDISISLLGELVEERVKLYCGAFLDQCFITPDFTIQPIDEKFTELHYIAQLVDHLVNNSIASISFIFKDVINLISYVVKANYVATHNQFRMWYILKQYPQILTPDLLSDICPSVCPEINFTLLETKVFTELFSFAWQTLYKEVVLDPENGHFLDLNRAAHRIYEEGHNGAIYFNRINHFPFTQEDVYSMLECYEKIISAPNQYYKHDELLNFLPNLLYPLLLTVCKREADRMIPAIVSCVVRLLKSKEK